MNDKLNYPEYFSHDSLAFVSTVLVATKAEKFTQMSQEQQLSDIFLSIGGQLQTTDKRDRHTTEILRPDYNKTYPELAFDLATYFIRNQNLAFLKMLEKLLGEVTTSVSSPVGSGRIPSCVTDQPLKRFNSVYRAGLLSSLEPQRL